MGAAVAAGVVADAGVAGAEVTGEARFGVTAVS